MPTSSRVPTNARLDGSGPGSGVQARTNDDGTFYYLDGLLHRDDGPAIEFTDGTKKWYHAGLEHRTDGPALTSPDGVEWWRTNGLRHRLDGPAFTSGEFTQWCVNDVALSVNDEQLLEAAIAAGEPDIVIATLTIWTPEDELADLLASVRAAHTTT